MSKLEDFYKAAEPITKIRDLTDEESKQLDRYDIPLEIKQFLIDQGLSSYKDNFFSTTLPQWQMQTLTHWGFIAGDCFAFMKTAFGGLIYYSNGKIYRLNPFTGRTIRFSFDFIDFMEITLFSESSLEGCYYDIYQSHQLNTSIQHDEIYALVPALPLGGSFETSSYEKVKMYEHLAFLAQMYDNKATVL